MVERVVPDGFPPRATAAVVQYLIGFLHATSGDLGKEESPRGSGLKSSRPRSRVTQLHWNRRLLATRFENSPNGSRPIFTLDYDLYVEAGLPTFALEGLLSLEGRFGSASEATAVRRAMTKVEGRMAVLNSKGRTPLARAVRWCLGAEDYQPSRAEARSVTITLPASRSLVSEERTGVVFVSKSKAVVVVPLPWLTAKGVGYLLAAADRADQSGLSLARALRAMARERQANAVTYRVLVTRETTPACEDVPF